MSARLDAARLGDRLMATNVAMDSLLDAMVTQLSQLVPTTGQPLTTQRPVRTVQRYLGAEFQTVEGQKRGIAGRTPALRVRWAATKTLRTSISRRVDRVESTVSVVVASDNQHGKDERKAVLALAESVRALIGGRSFGLAVTPLRYRDTVTLRDEDSLLALSVMFAVRHRVDLTIDPGTDVFDEARGSIVNAAVTRTSLPAAPTVTPQGTPAGTAWSYAVVGIDAAGLRTLISPSGSTATGAATLTGVNFNHIAWAAYPGIVSYEIERTAAGGTPNTTGKIGTTTALTFNDTGLDSLGATPPDPLHVDLHEVYP